MSPLIGDGEDNPLIKFGIREKNAKTEGVGTVFDDETFCPA